MAVANAHHYTVEFRIFSDVIDPATITRELDLHPCQVRVLGSRRADGKIFTGMWAFNGITEEGPQAPEWDSLEDGLVHLLEILWSRREAIAQYAANAELIWWCGHFQRSFDGGPRLSPGLLTRLGAFGAALYIDNYFSDVG
jgi:hypothetical protein